MERIRSSKTTSVKGHFAFAVYEIDRAPISLLIGFNQVCDRCQRQSDACDANDIPIVITHLIIDENGQAGPVDGIAVDIDFIGFDVVARLKIPNVGWVFFTDFFDDPARVVIIAGFFGDEIRRNRIVAVLDFTQILDDLVVILFTRQRPVADKCVMRHQR